MAHAVSRQPKALRRLRLVNAHTGETFDGAYVCRLTTDAEQMRLDAVLAQQDAA
jgi:hypothetical protein